MLRINTVTYESRTQLNRNITMHQQCLGQQSRIVYSSIPAALQSVSDGLQCIFMGSDRLYAIYTAYIPSDTHSGIGALPCTNYMC